MLLHRKADLTTAQLSTESGITSKRKGFRLPGVWDLLLLYSNDRKTDAEEQPQPPPSYLVQHKHHTDVGPPRPEDCDRLRPSMHRDDAQLTAMTANTAKHSGSVVCVVKRGKPHVFSDYSICTCLTQRLAKQLRIFIYCI